MPDSPLQTLLRLWRLSLDRSILLRFLRFLLRLWRERVTRPGRFVLMAGGGTVIAGAMPDFNIGAILFPLFLVAALTSLGFALFHRPRLTLQRSIPARCVADSQIPLTITLRNPTTRPMYDIGAYEYRLPPELELQGEPQFHPQLDPGQSQTFPFLLKVAKRGIYQLPGPTSLCCYPLGIFQSNRFQAQPTRLVVYPKFHPLQSLRLPVSPRYQPGGIALTSNIGLSMEFIGNREYRMGDRQRDLHPRSWARVGYPIVRQFQEEFLCRIAILVDTYIPSSSSLPWWHYRNLFAKPAGPGRDAASPRLEANLSLAAAVADQLSRQEYVVDLFAAGPELYHFQAGRSLAYLDNILDILSCIDPCRADPLSTLGAKFSEELSQISTVVLLLLHWDAPRRRLLEQVREAGAQVKLIVISDTVDPAQVLASGVDAQCFTPAQILAGVDAL